MKTASDNPQDNELSTRAVSDNSPSALLILAGMALCVVAIPAFAQDLQSETAVEKGYTIPRGVTTPIVMKTLPDAACDLHAVGVGDAAHSLRINANGDGYFKFHVTPREEGLEGEHMQIDCASDGNITTYLLQVRVSDAPTPDMPAPQTVMPPPSGSKVLPTLTESEAQSVSREELLARGYPPRPDGAASPELYAKWLNVVSRPITLLPSHGTASAEMSRHQSGVTEGPLNQENTHWSGLVAEQESAYYYGIQASWNVPKVGAGAGAWTPTYSGFWVGLDGYQTSDVEQAGTEQDYIAEGKNAYANYYAWTELYPAQPQAQQVMSVDAGDPMTVWVWIGDSDSAMDINGGYVWYYISDNRSGQTVITHTALNYTYVTLTSAEWIMERPLDTATNHLDILSNYNKAYMTDAYVLIENGTWVTAQSISNVQLTMYNEGFQGTDNNELSSASLTGPTSMTFSWHNFH
jgi:hypothetical protein